MDTYQPIIGLEVHVELATKSKMFCGCPADHFGRPPNTITCPVCLGLPGALPVPNKKAVEWTILLGLALGCTINEESKFDRKNYFYPDLPKGYQISQYDQPLAIDGLLQISTNQLINQSTNQLMRKAIRISRVHLEEDTGKLQHATVDGRKLSLVDFNRSGVPLVEIVTEPDFRSVEEVDEYVKKLQQIVRYLGISSADMEKGIMRLEPSISLRTQNPELNDQKTPLPGYRVELKNINSFRFARRALEYEIERQSELLSRGEQPTQQTRGWNEAKAITVAQREKEEAHDYRYFPEPDIPPMRFAQNQISKIKDQIGELPEVKKERFIKEYALSAYDATQLVETRERADYFEKCLKLDSGNQHVKKDQDSRNLNAQITPKTIANWLINKKIDITVVSPQQLVTQIAQSTQVSAVSDAELEKVVAAVLSQSPQAITDYKSGKQQALMFLLGQCIRALKGAGDKQNLLTMLQEKLHQYGR